MKQARPYWQWWVRDNVVWLAGWVARLAFLLVTIFVILALLWLAA